MMPRYAIAVQRNRLDTNDMAPLLRRGAAHRALPSERKQRLALREQMKEWAREREANKGVTG